MTEKKQRFKYRKGFYFEFDDIKDDLDFYEIDLEPNSNEFDDSNLFYLFATSESNIIHLTERLNKLHEENQQLRKELLEFKEWEKHIGDVQREELDRVFKMSVYEIAEAFQYYEKKIKEMEDLE